VVDSDRTSGSRKTQHLRHSIAVEAMLKQSLAPPAILGYQPGPWMDASALRPSRSPVSDAPVMLLGESGYRQGKICGAFGRTSRVIDARSRLSASLRGHSADLLGVRNSLATPKGAFTGRLAGQAGPRSCNLTAATRCPG